MQESVTYAGERVFVQIMEHLPLHRFPRIVVRNTGKWKVTSISYLAQLLCITVARLAFRKNQCDIEAHLRPEHTKQDDL